MKSPLPIARRLRERHPDASGAEARMGEIVRSMKDPPRISAEAHARILRRVRGADARKVDRGMLRRPALAMVVALAIVLLGMGAQAGVIARALHAGWSWIRAQRQEPLELGRIAYAPEERRAPRSFKPAPAPGPAAIEVPPPTTVAPAPSARQVNDRAPARPAIRPPGRAARDEPSALALESRLLATALDQLRTNHDYAGALATLAEYDARFPTGALRSEANLTRLESLMSLGQGSAALRLLDQTEIRGPRAAEMLVLRGELRASAGRYGEAIHDFDRALSPRTARTLQERALYGRASCRSRVGDVSGAKEELEEYLVRFPDGPHALEVRRTLR